MGVGLENHAARRLHEPVGFVASDGLEITTCSHVGSEGVTRTAAETHEYLTRVLDERSD